MLTALRLENFKSFKDERIELGPTTLLLGANASGKSNFLDALRFLQGVALGFSIEEVLGGKTAGGREIWPGIRGGAKEIGFRGAKEFRITSEWEIKSESLIYSIWCSLRSIPIVTAESLLTGDRTPLLSGSLVPSDKVPAGQEHTQTYHLSYGLAGQSSGFVGEFGSALDAGIGRRLPEPDPSKPEWSRARDRIQSLQSVLRSLSVLDPIPREMRDYVEASRSELGASGENLAAMLAARSKDPEERIALVDWLTELCGPEVVDIDFSRTEYDDVMLVLVDAAGARTSARSLSDGTLRFLALLVALRDTIRNKILLLEEIESGLHPARLHLLVEQLEARAEAAGAQVIATTHSPTLLAALPDPTLRDAVVFASIPGHEGTLMRRLGDLPDFDEVVRRRGIEHLFTTRWLERSL